MTTAKDEAAEILNSSLPSWPLEDCGPLHCVPQMVLENLGWKQDLALCEK